MCVLPEHPCSPKAVDALKSRLTKAQESLSSAAASSSPRQVAANAALHIVRVLFTPANTTMICGLDANGHAHVWRVSRSDDSGNRASTSYTLTEKFVFHGEHENHSVFLDGL